MVDDEITRRKKLTFAQAEGADPLPAQLLRTKVSSELKAVLWEFIFSQIKATSRRETYEYLGKPWDRILRVVHVLHDHLSADEFQTRFTEAIRAPKVVFEEGGYVEIYGWLQFVLRNHPPQDFAKELDVRLQYCRSAYRVVDGDTLCPVGSDEEAATITKAFGDLKSAGLSGSRGHLKAAADFLGSGAYPDSIRESIHAVESAVRVIEPSGDFSKALAKLEAKTNLHGAMKKGFLALYGFSSDEQGIRHALLEQEAAAVDEADALFMIGACSAFLSYLTNKARKIAATT